MSDGCALSKACAMHLCTETPGQKLVYRGPTLQIVHVDSLESILIKKPTQI